MDALEEKCIRKQKGWFFDYSYKDFGYYYLQPFCLHHFLTMYTLAE